MDDAALLSTLRARDVRLWIEDSHLKCSAPVGALDAELKHALASRKQAIMAILRQAEARNVERASIVPIKPDGSRPPIFAVSGHGGDIFCMLPLARHLHAEQPMIGIQPPGLDGSEPLSTVQDLARYEVQQIRKYRPEGPYLISGHCAGGALAFEVAQQLTAMRQKVALLALIGSAYPTMFNPTSLLLVRLSSYLKVLTPSAFKRRLQLRQERQKGAELVGASNLAARSRVENATVAAVYNYTPQFYDGHVDLFITADWWHRPHLWKPLARSVSEHHLERFEVNDLLIGEHVGVLAGALQERLNQIGV